MLVYLIKNFRIAFRNVYISSWNILFTYQKPLRPFCGVGALNFNLEPFFCNYFPELIFNFLVLYHQMLIMLSSFATAIGP